MHHCTMQCKASRVIKCKDHLCASLYTLYNRVCYLLDAVGLSKFDLGNQKNEILASRREQGTLARQRRLLCKVPINLCLCETSPPHSDSYSRVQNRHSPFNKRSPLQQQFLAMFYFPFPRLIHNNSSSSNDSIFFWEDRQLQRNMVACMHAMFMSKSHKNSFPKKQYFVTFIFQICCEKSFSSVSYLFSQLLRAGTRLCNNKEV